MAEHPDWIEVIETQKTELSADRVDLFVTIRGSSLVTGKAALEKAHEVRQLVVELKKLGVEEANIQLEGVRAETAGGVLGKSSSAHYSLRLADTGVEQLADVLGVITGQKNITMNSLEWRYPDDDELRAGLLDLSLRKATDKANRIATQLGVKIIGIYEMVEQPVDNRTGEREYFGAQPTFAKRDMAPVARARIVTSDDLGLEVSHSKEISVTISVKYRISSLVTS